MLDVLHVFGVLEVLGVLEELGLLEVNDNLLHLVQLAAKSVCLQLNASKTKWMHFSPTSDERVHALYSSRIEKVNDFK